MWLFFLHHGIQCLPLMWLNYLWLLLLLLLLLLLIDTPPPPALPSYFMTTLKRLEAISTKQTWLPRALATPGTFHARSHPRAFPRARPFTLTCTTPSPPPHPALLGQCLLTRRRGSPAGVSTCESFCWFYFLFPPLECKFQQDSNSQPFTALLSSSRSLWPPMRQSTPSLHPVFSFAFLLSVHYHPVYSFISWAPRAGMVSGMPGRLRHSTILAEG